jgi:GAF domain-containing protein
MDDLIPSAHCASRAARIYADAAATHQSSARLLRSNGDDAAADRVERFAAFAWHRVTLAVAARAQTAAGKWRGDAGLGDLLEDALDGAIAFLDADFGNIQLVDPHTKVLRIAAQRGFAEDFLAHFAVVDDEDSACGRAAAARLQNVIADVAFDPGFAPHRAIAAAAGFRAVQSTPLIDGTGCLRGVLSTHYTRAGGPPNHELRLIEVYARLVADALARGRG